MCPTKRCCCCQSFVDTTTCLCHSVIARSIAIRATLQCRAEMGHPREFSVLNEYNSTTENGQYNRFVPQKLKVPLLLPHTTFRQTTMGKKEKKEARTVDLLSQGQLKTTMGGTLERKNYSDGFATGSLAVATPDSIPH